MGELPGARAQRAQRAVDLPRAGLEGQHRVGHAEREVLVAVEADLRLRADLTHERLDTDLRVGQHQRAGGVDDVDALGARRRP